MGYRFRRGEAPFDGVRRIACEQYDRALDALTAGEPDVHDARKSCKKLRALLRLARPALPEEVYRRENAAIRDTARGIAGLRDAEALLEAFDALVGHGGDAGADVASLRRRLDAAGRDAAPGRAAVRAAEEALRAGRLRVADWVPDAGGDEADALCRGLARTYRSGRKRLAAARLDPAAETLHEWRKQVKYHWYHVRLLAPIDPDTLGPRGDALKTLSDLLGDDHDLAMLDPALAALPAAELGALPRVLTARRETLQASAFELGESLFADRPKALRRYCRRCWRDG
ncbi:CHAD domain-containing protein [Salinisphaera sp. PC39]|uniref:CHAD domain-containing protein n=1 Tax=Salinisphaera sp. PC39 TaxID=1304156 RepID=UPI00333FDEB3